MSSNTQPTINPPQIQIQTPRLLLRPAFPTDLPFLYTIMSHPDCMRYWSTPPHTNVSQTQSYLNNMISSPTNGTLDFAIELLSAPGSMIGKAGLWDGREIGVLMAREHWGKGYAREALETVLTKAWEWDGEQVARVQKIIADVDPRNQACLVLLGKLGFQKTGFEERTWEVGGEWVDSIYLGLERPADR